MSREKELNFFSNDKKWSEMGIKWYESNFSSNCKILGESSPSYSWFPVRPNVPERMASVIPETKLIYIVRNPIERTIAHYVHSISLDKESRSFEQAVELHEDNSYVVRSRYFFQIERFLGHFHKSQFLVVSSDDLLHRRDATLKAVFRFLDVDPHFESWRFSIERNKTTRRRRKTRAGRVFEKTIGKRFLGTLPPELRNKCDRWMYMPLSRRIERPVLSESQRGRMWDILRDDMRRIEEFAGRKLGNWVE